MRKIISCKQEDLVYSDDNNEWLKVYFDQVVFPDGRHGRYNRIVESDGRPGVAILPIRDDCIGLVQQYRYPIEREVWEIPRGFGACEKPRDDARRELREETGIVGATLIDLGFVYPNSGLLASVVYMFAAKVSSQTIVENNISNEVKEFCWIPLTTALEQIADGEINDSFTLSAVMRAQLRKLL